MMLTYGITILVLVAWIIKGFRIRRTFLDIPIILYLVGHIISTVWSIDFHISIWGYYGRFHEGLMATISYIVLYYAAVSNLKREDVLKIIYSSIISATIIAIWGIFEHFGKSPSCLFITGKFDVECWVQDVKNRVYATLGQPNWMAAYLDVLILISLGFVRKFEIRNLKFTILPALFFISLIFTKSRSGFLGLAVGAGTFILLTKNIRLILLAGLVGLIGAGYYFSKPAAPAPKITNPEISISESGDIRKVVWEGAIDVWKRYPIFGSGVETFAYAYYLDRPVAHNMLSEWDFLYNKAHNEYLNILATTGAFGFITYAMIILGFAIFFIKERDAIATLQHDRIMIGLFAGWVSILVTNFFGFSVVIVGLYFFLIPAFCIILKNEISADKKQIKQINWIVVCIVGFIALLWEFNLINMWQADVSYAYGKNLDGVNHFSDAYSYLQDAVKKNPDEPQFRDELSYNEAVLAGAMFEQSKSSSDSALIDQAISDSNKTVEISPMSLPFWKTRTKVFYTLATIDRKYILTAVEAIATAAKLAPTDAKVHYNYGLILGQAGQVLDAIKVFEETLKLKPDYQDARNALELYKSSVVK